MAAVSALTGAGLFVLTNKLLRLTRVLCAAACDTFLSRKKKAHPCHIDAKCEYQGSGRTTRRISAWFLNPSGVFRRLVFPTGEKTETGDRFVPGRKVWCRVRGKRDRKKFSSWCHTQPMLFWCPLVKLDAVSCFYEAGRCFRGTLWIPWLVPHTHQQPEVNH